MAILCGSYKIEAAALSKSNLVRKILADVSQAISHDAVCRPTNGLFDSAEALPLRKRSISTRLRSAPDGRERTKTGVAMSSPQIATGDRIVDPMIALAGCSKRQRIMVAGSKSMELMLELHRRGYLLAAAAGNCGRPTGQYDVTFVDWRRRTLHALEPTMDWLMNFLNPRAVLVVWVDAQKPAANESLRTSVTKCGFVIVRGAVHECGCALLARRSQDYPVQKAA
jgi:hypothetical protein